MRIISQNRKAISPGFGVEFGAKNGIVSRVLAAELFCAVYTKIRLPAATPKSGNDTMRRNIPFTGQTCCLLTIAAIQPQAESYKTSVSPMSANLF